MKLLRFFVCSVAATTINDDLFTAITRLDIGGVRNALDAGASPGAMQISSPEIWRKFLRCCVMQNDAHMLDKFLPCLNPLDYHIVVESKIKFVGPSLFLLAIREGKSAAVITSLLRHGLNLSFILHDDSLLGAFPNMDVRVAAKHVISTLFRSVPKEHLVNGFLFVDKRRGNHMSILNRAVFQRNVELVDMIVQFWRFSGLQNLRLVSRAHRDFVTNHLHGGNNLGDTVFLGRATIANDVIDRIINFSLEDFNKILNLRCSGGTYQDITPYELAQKLQKFTSKPDRKADLQKMVLSLRRRF